MDGDESKQIEHLREQSKTFGAQIRSANCSKVEAMYTCVSSFLKTIEYPLACTSIAEKTWDRIVAPALGNTLQKAGIVQSAPRVALYAPRLHQGWGWMHPFENQGLSHLETLLQESMSSSQTGASLQQTAEALRVEVGVPFELGITPTTPYASYVTPSWCVHTWKCAESRDLHVQEDFPDMPLL